MKTRLISSLAGLGALETGYLTFSKLTSTPIATSFCTNGGTSCNDVLSSPYATIPTVNIPLVAIGCVGYLSILALSTMYERQVNNKQRTSTDSVATPIPSSVIADALLFTSTAMTSFSAYLMTILFFIIRDNCSYCFLSAALSTSIAALAWKERIVPNVTKAFVLTSSSTLVTAMASALLFYSTSNSPAVASTAPAAQFLQSQAEVESITTKQPPHINTHSSTKAMALAEKLQQLDAKMYGAYWCSHCFNQKQEFGQEAMAKLPYIECDKEGVNSQYPLCRQKKVSLNLKSHHNMPSRVITLTYYCLCSLFMYRFQDILLGRLQARTILVRRHWTNSRNLCKR